MRLLIAEDDQVLADGLLRTLRSSGAAVDHVADGAQADAALMTNTWTPPNAWFRGIAPITCPWLQTTRANFNGSRQH